MAVSAVIELLGQMAFSFTRSVMEHYNPEEPEFTAESFGFDYLEDSRRQWYSYPVDEFIYQEYDNRKGINTSYLAARSINVTVVNAFCTKEEETPKSIGNQQEDRAMAWKRLRPSFLHTISKSLYIGALISLLAATILGAEYLLLSYVSYKTFAHCKYFPKKLIPHSVQWTITECDVIACGIFYVCSFCHTVLLFLQHQIQGLKTNLVLICCLFYCFDALYRVILQVIGRPFFLESSVYKVPMYVLYAASYCLQLCYLARKFGMRSRPREASLICKLVTPLIFAFTVASAAVYFIYPAYKWQHKSSHGRLLIAIFSPLIGVTAKVISRICVQRLWNITHPGYSYILLAPLYFSTAVIFRVLQAELGSLLYIAALGIIHGITEVVERSVMVAVDHCCHQLWRRELASWGSFRTPRRERLMADIAIMSMMFESTAIVSVNGFLFFYQYFYLENDSLLTLLRSFSITVLVQMVIEWFFTSASLAIETRYQNLPVMAVWQRRWKRFVLVASVTTIPIAMWTSGNLLMVIDENFEAPSIANRSCKMPFT